MASPSSVPIYVVDAFTDRPFSGNPAAVCLPPAWPNDSWLHKVAAEMNLSETAFLVPNEDGFDLRWLTPQVEVESERALRALSPDFRKLASVPVRGVIVTARSSRDEFDFVSRFFAPASGIDEDPVTGSAHCTLASHWREKTGKNEFKAYQASARGGSIGVRIEGQRVLLTGRAVLVVQGQLVAS